MHNPKHILAVLDDCSDSNTFPMLDNGYVYLAASRLSLFRSEADWALVIEIFGFSPRSGSPDVHVHTFASRLHDRDTRDRYVNQEAYEKYLRNNPNNESRFFFPMAGSWQDQENDEFVAEDAAEVLIRQAPAKIPPYGEYERHGIVLEQLPRVHVFELCRLLADTHRDSVLATAEERRVSVRPEIGQILQLEEWHHPDLVVNERPSDTEAFRQLARVLATGDVASYRPSRPPNTHWRNWPEGGRL